MNSNRKMDIYHFSDEISALSRDFYHVIQNETPGGSEMEYTLQEWIPLFVEFIKRTMNDGKENKDEIVATSPEFKELLKNVKPWDGSLPARWR